MLIYAAPNHTSLKFTQKSRKPAEAFGFPEWRTDRRTNIVPTRRQLAKQRGREPAQPWKYVYRIRKVPPRDRRSYCLYLTEEGERAVRRLETLVLRHEEEFTRVLSADERHILVRLLTRLHQQEEPGTRATGVTAVDETAALT